jgi:hypothetical protein
VHPFWPLLLLAYRRAAFDFNVLIYLVRLIDSRSRPVRFYDIIRSASIE